MKIQSDSIPTIGVAQLIGSINVVTLKCTCANKEILTGIMGQPIVCHTCNKVWFVSGESKIRIQEVLGDVMKSESSKLKLS